MSMASPPEQQLRVGVDLVDVERLRRPLSLSHTERMALAQAVSVWRRPTV